MVQHTFNIEFLIHFACFPPGAICGAKEGMRQPGCQDRPLSTYTPQARLACVTSEVVVCTASGRSSPWGFQIHQRSSCHAMLPLQVSPAVAERTPTSVHLSPCHQHVHQRGPHVGKVPLLTCDTTSKDGYIKHNICGSEVIQVDCRAGWVQCWCHAASIPSPIRPTLLCSAAAECLDAPMLIKTHCSNLYRPCLSLLKSGATNSRPSLVNMSGNGLVGIRAGVHGEEGCFRGQGTAMLPVRMVDAARPPALTNPDF